MTKEIVDTLDEFATPKRQWDQWIWGSNPATVSTLEESYSGLFDTCQFESFVDEIARNDLISLENRRILEEFISTIRPFIRRDDIRSNGCLDAKKAIQHEEWPAIVRLAGASRDIIAAVLKDSGESVRDGEE